MKKMYVPKTLTEFLNESKSITLKRKYGQRPSIVVGTNAPLRNQVLSYVAESGTVSKRDLKQFIIGLKEGGSTPAAANMFLKRNSKYFLVENRNGISYFKLSNIGKRLVNQFVSTQNLNVSESEKDEVIEFPGILEKRKLSNNIEDLKNLKSNLKNEDVEDEDEDLDEEGLEDDEYSDVEAEDLEAEDFEDEGPADEVDFEDDRFDDVEDEDFEDEEHAESDQFEYEEDDEKIVLTYYKDKGEEDEDLEVEELEDEDEELEDFEDEELEDEDLDDFEDEELDEEDDENLEDDEDYEDEEIEEGSDRPNDEFREYDFKDKGRPGVYDMDESESIKERMRDVVERLKSKRAAELNEAQEPDESDELSDEDLEKLGGGDEDVNEPDEVDDETATTLDDEGVEKVEITEFIITVDNPEEAIAELAELGVTAERVPVEPKEEEVPAPVEEPEEEPEGEEDLDLGENPEEEDEESKKLDATKESLQAFVQDLLNEEEEPDEDQDLGSSDELSLGDQGEEAKELEDQPEDELAEPTAEYEENKIKVPADEWPKLKPWLEEKNVDIKQMFGGDIEMEDVPEEGGEEVDVEEPGEEISDDDIDFSGVSDEDETKLEDKKE